MTGAINGVTLDLLKADVGNFIGVDVKENRSEVTASINNFVQTYNDLAASIDSLTSYDPEKYLARLSTARHPGRQPSGSDWPGPRH